MTETQESINQWGNETFGYKPWTSAPVRLKHMIAEVGELAEAVANFQVANERYDGDGSEPERQECAEEIGDVAILLMSLADALDLQVTDCVDKKMAINRARKWVRLANGGVVREEKTVLAEASK